MPRDPAGVADFYAKVFGCKGEPPAGAQLRIFETGNKNGHRRRILQPRTAIDPGRGTMLFYFYGRVDDLGKVKPKSRERRRHSHFEEQEIREWYGCALPDPPRRAE